MFYDHRLDQMQTPQGRELKNWGEASCFFFFDHLRNVDSIVVPREKTILRSEQNKWKIENIYFKMLTSKC